MNPTTHNRPGRSLLHGGATVLVALLIVGNLFLIGGFSSESREESGSRSREVTLSIARILYSRFEDFSAEEQNEIVDSLHGIVRKAAHFSEFASLGCLTAIFARLTLGLAGWRSAFLRTAGIPAVFCLLCAISDEVHQIFTGRGPRVTDVLIDFAGAVSGICLMHILIWAAGRIRAANFQKKEAAAP